jgi:hypothetical protein
MTGEFMWHMEDMLTLYEHPDDPRQPDVCCDERPCQLVVDLVCTKRLSLTSLNYTFLNVFPNDKCAGRPGHIETYTY